MTKAQANAVGILFTSLYLAIRAGDLSSAWEGGLLVLSVVLLGVGLYSLRENK